MSGLNWGGEKTKSSNATNSWLLDTWSLVYIAHACRHMFPSTAVCAVQTAVSKYEATKQKRKFSSFFKSLVIELDKDLYGPDNHLVEVRSGCERPTRGLTPTRRPPGQNVPVPLTTQRCAAFITVCTINRHQPRASFWVTVAAATKKRARHKRSFLKSY